MARIDYTKTEREQSINRVVGKHTKSKAEYIDDSPSTEVNTLYLNKAQELVFNFGARVTTVEAGRGTGKTDGLITPRLVCTSDSLPGGSGLWVGVSLKQLFSKTVPNTVAAIERMYGLLEGRDFVRGRPNPKLGFLEPKIKPRIWDNVICFKNGFIWYMISTGVKAAANGMNSCSILMDEARFAPEAVFKSEILPTLRGITSSHPGFDETKNPYYKGLFLVSDSPFTRRQEWLRKRADEQTLSVNKRIARMLHELEECKEMGGPEFAAEIANSPKFVREINKLRCQSNVYFSFSTLENISILGEEYIKSMQRELTPSMFNVAILNKQNEKINDGYYSNLNIDEVHGYTNSDDSQMEAAVRKYNSRTITQVYTGGRTLRVENECINFDALRRDDDCSLDTDLIPGEPLRIGMDYNANINALCVGQTPSRRDTTLVRVLKSFVNTKSTRLEGLMDMFHKYYAPHQSSCRDVIFYYDSTAKQGGSYASEHSDETKFYRIVANRLKKHGWKVMEVSMGTPMSHNKKYEFLNGCLAGTQKPFIRINRENNEYLIGSLENAGLVEGRNGFQKDKSKEKYRVAADAIDPEAELATRTDLSDAFDTLIIGVRYYNAGSSVGLSRPMMG